jgi:hypothetical protein
MKIIMGTLMYANLDAYTTDNDYGFFCDPAIPEYTPPINNNKYHKCKYMYHYNEDTIYEDDLESYNEEHFTSRLDVKKTNKSSNICIYGGIAVGSIIITNILFTYNLL